MNIAVISFTVNGYELSGRIAEILKNQKEQISIYTKSKYLEKYSGISVQGSLQQWAGDMFAAMDALIFVGASGIAVRAIAPHIRNKTQDPAVLLLDEQGNFCIPLLAGHIGGANELALRLCSEIGSIPVITTATDVNKRFAVDVFATKNDLYISNMELAKEVSAQLLHGGRVGFSSELPVKGELPRGLVQDKEGQKLGIHVGIHYNVQPFEKTLWLIPRYVTLGIGCRRDTSQQTIEASVEEVCQMNCMFQEAISQAASIDLKKEEEGILKYCKQHRIPFLTYDARELNQIEGTFSGSDFVASVTGVDNVCERSAKAASQTGIVFQNKIAKNGVTVAFAIENRSVEF